MSATSTTEKPNARKLIRVSPSQLQKNAEYVAAGESHKCKPAIVVETIKPSGIHHTQYAWDVQILGPSRVVQNEENPLSSGTRVWVETEAEILLVTSRGDG